jgi:hypothetical protein
MSSTTALLNAVAILAIGSTAYEWNRASRVESELAALAVDRDGLRAKLGAEQQNSARATQELAALRGELEALKAKPMVAAVAQTAPAATRTEPAKGSQEQRSLPAKAVQNNLRQIAAAIDRFVELNGRSPSSLDELVGEGKLIRQLDSVAGEDYSRLPLAYEGEFKVTMSNGGAVSYKRSAVTTSELQNASELWIRVKPAVAAAETAYRAANHGSEPPTPEALIPYFATPQEGADFVEYREAAKQSREPARPGRR